MSASQIKGWCPGALRPMESGDGLVLRLKFTAGLISPDLAIEIARWSGLWGNGQIDVTGRARLQLRGVEPGHLPKLHSALAERGLLDDSEAAEAVRNVLSSPLSELDPEAICDLRGIAQALEQRLSTDEALHRLPPKFDFLVDAGGSFGLEDISADIGFVAHRAATGPAFAVTLDGAAGEQFGRYRPEDIPQIAASLASAFLDMSAETAWGVRRMRDLVASYGAAAILRHAGLPDSPAPMPGSRQPRTRAYLGPNPLGAEAFLGVGLPYGRASDTALGAIARSCADYGVGALHLSPWRAILLPVPSVAAARRLQADLAGHGFIFDRRDPRGRIAACPGGPACREANTPVRADADRLAAGIDLFTHSGIALHVSGCGKGCAHPRSAPITLVGRQGRYDIVEAGKASDQPIATGLGIAEVEDYLIRRSGPGRTGRVA